MAEAFTQRGLSVHAAFEFEFSVGLDVSDGAFEPAHEGPGYSDIALVRNHDFALDLLTAMEAQGLGLQQLHPEYADGQFEMSIAPRDPVAAADAAMVVRQTVRAVARRHGLVTSFAPQVGRRYRQRHAPPPQPLGRATQPARGRRRSGGHAAREGEAFVGRASSHELPALVGVDGADRLGYLRLQPHHWSGAMQCWGTENREAALRFIAGHDRGDRGSANVEIKPVDGTANPYLAVGALLAAALYGVDVRRPPAAVDRGRPGRASRRGQGGTGRAATAASTLAEAAERFAESTVLREAMGDFLFETFLATRRGEVEQYAGLDDDELIRRLRWRY